MQQPRDPYHHTRFRPRVGKDRLWRTLLAYLERFYPERVSDVLDLGSGYCELINNVAAPRRVAVDLWPGVREQAAAGVDVCVRSVADLSDLGLDRFDLVFASNIFEHLGRDDVRLCLAETRAVMRPGGRLLVIQPNFRLCYRSYFDDYTHVTVFTDRSLEDQLRGAGFAIFHRQPRFLPFSANATRVGWPWLLWCYLRSPIKPMAGQMLFVAEKPATTQPDNECLTGE